MNKVKLMNSAMMPHAGTYRATSITKEEFVHLVQTAHTTGQLESYVGYEQNAKLIKEWSGVHVQVNRETTRFRDGDIAIVMKLRYRVNPASKGQKIDDTAFEFMRVEYTDA